METQSEFVIYGNGETLVTGEAVTDERRGITVVTITSSKIDAIEVKSEMRIRWKPEPAIWLGRASSHS